jgi:hypothetical protein
MRGSERFSGFFHSVAIVRPVHPKPFSVSGCKAPLFSFKEWKADPVLLGPLILQFQLSGFQCSADCPDYRCLSSVRIFILLKFTKSDGFLEGGVDKSLSVRISGPHGVIHVVNPGVDEFFRDGNTRAALKKLILHDSQRNERKQSLIYSECREAYCVFGYLALEQVIIFLRVFLLETYLNSHEVILM